MEIKWSEALTRAHTSKEFFKEVKTHFKRNHPKLSYHRLAQQWGITSRSLVAEILNGTRRPSYRSFIQIARALSLTPNERELLKLLITKDDPKFSPSPQNIETALEKARSRLMKRKSISLSLPPSSELALELWPKVYSAVGKATTLGEVVRLTRESREKVQMILQELLKVGLLEFKAPHYSSSERHVSLDSRLHQKIITAFIHAELSEALPRIDSLYSKEDQLIFGGALMVKEKNLPLMKKKLKKILTQFIEDHYEPEGDSLVSLTQLMVK